MKQHYIIIKLPSLIIKPSYLIIELPSLTIKLDYLIIKTYSVPPNSKAALPKKQKLPYLIIKLAHLIKLNPTSTDPYTTITKPPYLIIKLP